jgi:hypothetical protein
MVKQLSGCIFEYFDETVRVTLNAKTAEKKQQQQQQQQQQQKSSESTLANRVKRHHCLRTRAMHLSLSLLLGLLFYAASVAFVGLHFKTQLDECR